MMLPFPIMQRLHRGEITPREAFALASLPSPPLDSIDSFDSPDSLAPPSSLSISALALLPDCIAKYPAGRGLVQACARLGIRLGVRTCWSGWRGQFEGARNAATWGMRWPHQRYLDGGRNVLFVENGLLGQRSGFTVDAAGYFADSSICRDAAWQEPVADTDRAALGAHLEREFHWEPGAGYNPAGPVLVALQTPKDAPLRHYCPRPASDARAYLIDAAARYLPADLPVLLRPHPRDDGFDPAAFRVPDGWQLDRSHDVYATLRTCSAVATANSTLAIEALGLGLPVAVLGQHVWTGSGAVLECAGAPERLADLPAYRPDPVAIEGLLCAILRRQMPFHADAERWLACAAFRVWAARVVAGSASDQLAESFQAAGMRLRASTDDLDQDLADAATDRLATCTACSRSRIMRRVIDADLARHGGSEPVFGPATVARLRAAGLAVHRPDLVGYRARWQSSAGGCTLPTPHGDAAEVTLGFCYGSHLGDALCTTPLAAALTACGRSVSVVRHRSTYAAFGGHGLAWRNSGRLRLSPPKATGSGHLIQRLLRWFRLPETAYPRPDLRLTDAERDWAAAAVADLAAPRILICPEAISNADGYPGLPWQSWADALRPCGSLIQPRLAHAPLDGARVLDGLTTRQFLALFSQADAYLGTWAAGIHAAAAFGLEALVVCTSQVVPAALTWPVPQTHIASFLYPQHSYGTPLGFSAGGGTMMPVNQQLAETLAVT